MLTRLCVGERSQSDQGEANRVFQAQRDHDLAMRMEGSAPVALQGKNGPYARAIHSARHNLCWVDTELEAAVVGWEDGATGFLMSEKC